MEPGGQELARPALLHPLQGASGRVLVEPSASLTP